MLIVTPEAASSLTLTVTGELAVAPVGIVTCAGDNCASEAGSADKDAVSGSGAPCGSKSTNNHSLEDRVK